MQNYNTELGHFCNLVLITSLLLSLFSTRIDAESVEVDAIPVQIQLLKQETAYKKVRIFTGTVEARRLSASGFEITGHVQQALVDEGARVQQGQLLAKLDTHRLEAAKREALAALKEVNANLSLAGATLKRIRQAVKIRGASKQELDEAIQKRDVAQAALGRQKAVIERIEVDLSKSQLYAPFEGVIISRLVDEGQVVAVGTPIVHVQESGAMEARVALANGLADQYQTGDKVELAIDQSRVFATVKSILPVRDSKIRTVDIIFTLEDSLNFRPGDLVELQVDRLVSATGFWVPIDSLTETYRGLWGVFVVKQGVVHRKVVELIYQDGKRAYVRGGLQAGEKMVMNGSHRLVPGQRVRFGLPLQVAEE